MYAAVVWPLKAVIGSRRRTVFFVKDTEDVLHSRLPEKVVPPMKNV